MHRETYNESGGEQLTKKERREMRRQEARVQQNSASRKRGIGRLLTWGIVIAVLVGLGWLVWRAAQHAPGDPGGGEALVVAPSPDDNSKGPENAPRVLVEYGDYQCPACAQFHAVVEQVFAASDGQLRVIYRHFPLKNIHPNAETAAQAVQAAGLQDRYWQMHNVVFERQSEWSQLSRGGAKGKFLEYAAELGLDTERLESDMDSDVVKDKIDADIEGANSAFVNSTPSFFVNGERITNFNSFEEFRRVVLGTTDAVAPLEVNTHDGSSMGEDL